MSYDADIEAVGGVPISGRYVKARKEHACLSCRQPIKAGDIYWRGAWRVGRELVPEIRCTDCIIAEEQI